MHLSRGTRVANWVLALASLGIYATVGAIYLIPLLFTCLFDYVVGAFLARSSDDRLRTAAFVVSVAVQLVLLCTFKYAGWLTGDFNSAAAAMGLGVAVTQLTLPLPPGISFYTFHTISYTADIYQRKFKPTGTFVDYVTFVAFFPQLIAGPIARASELLPQVAARTACRFSGRVRASLHTDRLGTLQEDVRRRQSRPDRQPRPARRFSSRTPAASATSTCMPLPPRSIATSRPTPTSPADWPSCSASN